MDGRIVWLFSLLCSTGAALHMTGPPTYTVRVGSIAHIPCTFTADKPPSDPRYFAVVWYLEENNILSYDDVVKSTDSRYSLNKHQALNGIADLIISDTSVSDGGVYTCTVNYSSFLMKREIRVDVLARPQLFILGKSVQRNKENTLTCMANGYFPNNINVTWYKDGEVLKNPLCGMPLRNDNGTYRMNSTVTITPSDDDRNKTFSCRVQHVSLQEPLQEDFQLTYESLSYVVIICIIIVFVVIALVIIICSQKIKPRKKAPRDSPSAISLEEGGGHQVSDNTQLFEEKVEEARPLNTNKVQNQIRVKTQKKICESMKKGKGQSTESPTADILAENNKPQSSDPTCKTENETL